MATISIQNIRDEIINGLRNANIFTIAVREVTTTTDTFIATAGQTQFTLTKTNMKNIRSVTVNAVSKALITDYSISWSTSKIILVTGAGAGESVVIQYDYGTDKIHPDFPREDLTISSFPRLGFEITSIRTEPLGLGGANHISDILMTVFLFMPVNRDAATNSIGGTEDLHDYMNIIRSYFRTNAKNFVSFKWMTPFTGTSTMRSHNDKVIQLNEDYSLKFIIE